MPKLYADFSNEISSDELYHGLLAHGLFTEKLPPIFTSEQFFNYCQTLAQPFCDKGRQYIYFESMRNINVPRPYGVPNPMAYQKLCRCLADNWYNIQRHFQTQTVGHHYKISRIHIRKLVQEPSLFEMNYNNWRTDGTPETDFLIGKRYVVMADISNCFPSIYTHSIPWALVGKEISKANRGQTEWYNQIDHYTQNLKNGETHGLLIGPHASNLISEIILTVIDQKLYSSGYKFIRNIDDYKCYVSTYEAGQRFLLMLNETLRSFDLSLNHKKTEILELPIAAVEQWVRKINAICLLSRYNRVDYTSARAYLDAAYELMRDNNMNSAVLNYAIKALSNLRHTENSIEYCVKTIIHLAIIYPYLVPLLDRYVFSPFNVSTQNIALFSQEIFNESWRCQNYEAVCYSIYFATKYSFEIPGLTADGAVRTKDCILMLLAYLYFDKRHDIASKKILKDYARDLSRNNDDLERNWLFVYEVLPQSSLHDEWKSMKTARISFVQQI